MTWVCEVLFQYFWCECFWQSGWNLKGAFDVFPIGTLQLCFGMWWRVWCFCVCDRLLVSGASSLQALFGPLYWSCRTCWRLAQQSPSPAPTWQHLGWKRKSKNYQWIGLRDALSTGNYGSDSDSKNCGSPDFPPSKSILGTWEVTLLLASWLPSLMPSAWTSLCILWAAVGELDAV